MSLREAIVPPDIATENGRFSTQPMCTDLTGECARSFLADLDPPEERVAAGLEPGKGPDSVQADLASGRVEASGQIWGE